MRITNGTLVRTFLNNLNQNRKNMSTYQEQLSSGTNFSRPSDNPFGVVKSMGLNTSINRNTQYARTIEDSTGWLNTTDDSLGQINDSMQRIRELLVRGSNGTNTQEERDAIRVEVGQRIEEIAQSGNATYGDRYIFAGTNTINPPFKSDGNGDLAATGLITSTPVAAPLSTFTDINREIAPNVVLKINVSKNDLLNGGGSGGTVDLKDTLSKILTALGPSGDVSQLGGSLLQGMQDNINNVLKLRAEVGAKQNRMDSAGAKNEEESYNMTETLSKTQDIDIAEKTMEYKVAETVYQASLMVGAKIIQPSLLDFLR